MSRFRCACVLALLIANAQPAEPQGFFGGHRGYDKVSWGVCTVGPCAITADVTVPYIALARLKFSRCYAAAKTGPAGSALIFDILTNGTSIFGGGAKLQIAAGAQTGQVGAFATPNLEEGDLVRLDITQIGSGTPGQHVSISCRLELR